MILKIILLILILLFIVGLIFFLVYILSPAVMSQTKIKEHVLFSKFEHKFNKLEKISKEKKVENVVVKNTGDEDEDEKENVKIVNNLKKAYVLCSCKKSFDDEKCKKRKKNNLSCAVIAKEYTSVGDCNFMCLGQGDCALFCQQNAIKIVNATAVITDFCIGCGECLNVCPKGIIKLIDVSEKSIIPCTNTTQKTTTCSCFQKEEKVEYPEKKYFKILQSWYKIIDTNKV